MRTKNLILIPLFVFTIVYLFIAFIEADFNPYKWEKPVRIIYIIMSTFFSLGAIGIYINEKSF